MTMMGAIPVQEVIELGGQVEAVAASAMALRERHPDDASVPVAAVQLLLSGTCGGSAGKEEEDAALSLARDENLMLSLCKVSARGASHECIRW